MSVCQEAEARWIEAIQWHEVDGNEMNVVGKSAITWVHGFRGSNPLWAAV